MSFSNLTELLNFLKGCVNSNGTQFSLTIGKIGSESIDHIIKSYLSSNQTALVLKDPTTPSISENHISFSGVIDTLLGLTPALIDLEFGLDGTQKATLIVSLSPLSSKQPNLNKNWTLGTSFPIWATLKSPLSKLEFATPVFYISSISSPATSTHPTLSEGLNFTAAELEYKGVLAILNNFPSTFKFKQLHGGFKNTLETPYVTISSDPISPIPIAYLDIPFVFSAVSEKYTQRGKIPTNPPDISTYLQLSSSIKIGSVVIPLKMQFTQLGAVIALVAELEGVSNYALSEFKALINKAPIGNYLSQYVDIGNTVGLRDLGIVLSTSPFGLAAIYLDLGTTAPLTVIKNYVEIPDISVNFWVNDPQNTKDITATIKGQFNFLTDVPVDITAVFPQMIFSGGLEQNSNLTIKNLFQKFIPSVKNIPDITIANLFVMANLKEENYNFNLNVVSEWKIPIGIAAFQLKEAEVALSYQKGAKGFGGEVSANAALFNSSNTEIASFYVDWNLPSDFLIKGEFPKINLSDLASTLTGGYLNATNGLPEIELENSTVSITIGEAGVSNYYDSNYYEVMDANTTYDFSLSTEIDVDKIGKADLYFEIKKTSELGFITGLVVQPNWTPASIWSGLKGVFDILVLKEAGLILSSIDDSNFSPPNFEKLPYKPDAIQPGITFFSELELKGDALSLIGKLFDSDITLQLYAFVNPKDLSTSEIKATLPGSQGQGIITFNGLTIDMKPGAGEFSIDASAILRIHGEQLTVIGSGVLHITPPSATFSLDIHCWKHPFGIKGLTIIDFGIGVGINDTGVTMGLLGNFLIGEAGQDQFKFLIGGEIIDFEAPGAFVFGLDDTDPNNPLKITDLIQQFTSLNLSEVPLLNGLAFKNIDFYVVDDPNGWQAPNGHFYKTGIGVDADILFYTYELKLLMEVNFDKGIIANGSINKPISILDILTISDATGDKGPNASIDTTNLSRLSTVNGLLNDAWVTAKNDDDCTVSNMDRLLYPETFTYPENSLPAAVGFLPINILRSDMEADPYFSFSGGIQFLGLTETFSGSATSDGFEVNFHAELADLFRAQFMCSYAKGKSFTGSAQGHFDLSLDFPNGLSIDGIPILPAFSIHGPNASLDIACAINLSDPYLSFDLDFNWGSFHFNPKFRIDAKAVVDLLSNLWEHIKNWINTNLKTFFKDLLSDVTKFVEAIANGVLKLGQDAFFVARALYKFFKQEITAVAKFLYHEIEFGFTAVVEALVKVFDVGIDEVLRIMEAIGEQCAVASGDLLIGSGDPITENNF
ncbi:hypothetical protein [Psychroserpens sp. SPM9]|uniref:hypothetical protein n=1 Tax=Psychroserpens sp. SPM9 TaxID=2975598 RepID=UPI0021A8D529|nr:hypothetical protein [Psychroserpens sp. SPM9]MDG5490533.1 hypothetical protein [Psychroserpens sp. SPM9]